MKKIVLVAIMFIMFASVVSAASINGDYKGNPIIKIKSEGKTLTVQDVPAIIYQGRAMVPIYLFEQLGMKLDWDAKTYSVNVVMPTNAVNAPDKNKEKAISDIKFYSSISNSYDSLDDLGSAIISVCDGYSLATQDFSSGYLKTANEQLNSVIDQYNSWTKIVDQQTSLLWSYGLYDSALVDVLVKYLSAINHLKEADEVINTYLRSLSMSDGQKFIDEKAKAFSDALDGKKIAGDKRHEYYLKVQNY